MQVWTRGPQAPAWKRWPSPLQALATLGQKARLRVLLLSSEPEQEIPELEAGVDLLRRICPEATEVIAASPHPSQRWRNRMHEIGIDHVWFVDAVGGLDGEVEAPPCLQEVNGGVCPALHTQTVDGCALSVCGRHDDRLVLAPRYISTWCLGHHKECPQWSARRGR